MKLPRRPAAIVFDMDGLLFDTETLYQEAAILAAADGGHDAPSGVFGQTMAYPGPIAEPFSWRISGRLSPLRISLRRG